MFPEKLSDDDYIWNWNPGLVRLGEFCAISRLIELSAEII